MDDPYAVPADDVRRLAREVNRQRQAEHVTQLRGRSLTTRQVIHLLASVSDRKGVDRRRARGSLLGLDALDLDDRINTGRLDRPLTRGAAPLLAVSHQLSDAVNDWWDATPPPIVRLGPWGQ